MGVSYSKIKFGSGAEGLTFTPGAKFHPWGPGVKLRMALCIPTNYVKKSIHNLHNVERVA
jgi:hypothetical protein